MKRMCPEMEAGLTKRMLLNWKRKFYEINILFCDELSTTNFPRRIVLRRIVREPVFIPFIGFTINTIQAVTEVTFLFPIKMITMVQAVFEQGIHVVLL